MTNKREEDLLFKARVGHGPSMYALGVAYLTGAFGPDREVEATRWLWLARNSDTKLAPWVDALLAEKGLQLEAPPTPKAAEPEAAAAAPAPEPLSAEALFKRVWEHAQTGDGMAMTILGYYIENGIACPADARTAFGWYEKSAQADNMFGLAEAARCLMLGIGTDKNPTKATRLYLKAVYSGHPQAPKILVAELLKGKDLPSDDMLAFTLAREGVDAGIDGLEGMLAFMYAYGRGTAEDKPRAHTMIVDMLRTKRGFSVPEGMNVNTKKLCSDMALYFDNTGDLVKAWLWFRLVPGDEAYIQVKLDNLKSKMTYDQRQELKTLLESISKK
ncbi:MAG: hypothetical protein GC134_09075 [Proteobacteria bacterium]|nr:hypothetical protein [Pseudomonadota bacterium]